MARHPFDDSLGRVLPFDNPLIFAPSGAKMTIHVVNVPWRVPEEKLVAITAY